MYDINYITNTVIKGDCQTELEKIENESIDCIVIDPPYRYIDHRLDRDFDAEKVFKELYRVLKKESFLVIFGIGSRLCRDIVMLEDIGFKVKEEAVWVKEKTSNFAGDLPRRHESFYFLTKGHKRFNKLYIDSLKQYEAEGRLDLLYKSYKSILRAFNNKEKAEALRKYIEENVIIYQGERKSGHEITMKGNSFKKNDRYFTILKRIKNGTPQNTCFFISREPYQYKVPTQKPLELMERIIKLTSNENDIVLDCFAGGGSTLKAALKNNRRFIGIEIDEEYYNICKENIKEIEEEKKEEQYALAL